MTKQSQVQKKTVKRVMHEFKHGDLKSGSGKKVKNPKQAIAIGLKKAGASKYESKSANKRNFMHTKQKERKGKSAVHHAH
jgi:hypothetical protein